MRSFKSFFKTTIGMKGQDESVSAKTASAVTTEAAPPAEVGGEVKKPSDVSMGTQDVGTSASSHSVQSSSI